MDPGFRPCSPYLCTFNVHVHYLSVYRGSPSIEAGEAAARRGGRHGGCLGLRAVAEALLVTQTQHAVMTLVVPAVLSLVITPGLVRVLPIIVAADMTSSSLDHHSSAYLVS